MIIVDKKENKEHFVSDFMKIYLIDSVETKKIRQGSVEIWWLLLK